MIHFLFGKFTMLIEIRNFLLCIRVNINYSIGSVSLQQISVWAKKILSNGEIIGEASKPYIILLQN